ncbi:MAG: hypothetical protein LAT64_14125 [Phycisphaerales bacterium]|nr:hypothetical protein [Planctomycetota bacterium]MCH8509888.1 hypothetical protein [Phycisphaerales bacterium]
MPHSEPIPITDPDQIQAMRRLIRIQAAFFVVLYALMWGLYLSAAYSMWKPFYALAIWVPSLLCLTIIQRRLLPHRRDGLHVFPYPMNLQSSTLHTLIGTMPVMIIVANPVMPGMVVFAMVGLPLIAAGVMVIYEAETGREPRPLSCPRCAYPVEDLSFPMMCPECAHPLPTASAATATPRVRHRRATGLGVLMILLALLVSGAQFVTPSGFRVPLPRAMLLHNAPTEAHAMEALDTDRLSDAERTNLAARIIDAWESGRGIPPRRQMDWVAEQILTERLPNDIVERFAFSDLGLDIIHRPASEPLTEISVQARADRRRTSAVDRLYFFAGFEIDGHGKALERSGQRRQILDIANNWTIRDRIRQQRNPPTGTPLPYPSATVHLTEPQTRVRAKVIVVLHDAARLPSITWHDDGSYTITPEPITVREFVAERVIRSDDP